MQRDVIFGLFGLALVGRCVQGTSCKEVQKRIVVPKFYSDDAERMCANYHCPRLGPAWDWKADVPSVPSTCLCVKKNCDCTVPMDNNDPDDYNMAHYHWEKDGCMLGWTENYLNSTEHYGTCEGNLGPCPWINRDKATRIVTSPAHCKVTKVSFVLAGGVSKTQNAKSDQWLGVKLVDEDGRLIRAYSLTPNSDNPATVLWDDLPGVGCYRVVLHDGQEGPSSYIKLQDVKIWGDAEDKMLFDLQCKGSDDDIWTDAGERLLRFGVGWGVDSSTVNSTKRMDIGASYIYKNSESPTVVTDVMIMTQARNVSDIVDCPPDYEKACSWLPDTRNTKGFDTQSITPWVNDLRGVGAALCLKKEPCVPGRTYVTAVKADAGSSASSETVPQTSGGCKYVGRWNPADGPDARSWTSGHTGSKWAALYQCKAICPHKTCARVVIRTMNSTGSSIDESSAASGDTIQLFKKLPNCVGDVPLTYKATLSTGEDITDESSYTLSRDLSHSFDSEISATATVEAEVGFSLFGNEAKAGGKVSIGASTSAGFSSSYTKGSTKMESTSETNTISSENSITVKPGKVVLFSVNMTSFHYSTEFIAQADCLDASGNVIESTRLDGVFRGRTYLTSGDLDPVTRPCYSDECQCNANSS